MTEIQVSDLDISTEIGDNDSSGWRHLSEIHSTSEDNNSSETDVTEWLDEKFYQSMHTVSNLEYVKLTLSNFTVKFQNCDPIIALFDTGATCSCIFYHLFTNILDKMNIIKKTLWVNTASGAN